VNQLRRTERELTRGADAFDHRAQVIRDRIPGVRFTLPTLGLRSLAGVVVESGGDLDSELMAQLDPNGKHEFFGLTREVGERDMYRGHVRLQLDGREETADVVLPSLIVHQIVQAQSQTEQVLEEAIQPGHAGRFAVPHRSAPRWAGSLAFPKVWTASEATATANGAVVNTGTGALRASPSAIVAVGLLASMDRCHVVRVPPEQVSVLPDWEGWENLTDFASDCHLPFEPLFLDFEGPGCLAARVGFKDQHELAVARLAVAEIGARVMGDSAKQREELLERITKANRELAYLDLVGAMLTRSAQHGGALCVEPIGFFATTDEAAPLTAYQPFGRVVFGGDPVRGVGSSEVELVDPQGKHVISRPAAVSISEIAGEPLPGFVLLPFTKESADTTGLARENLVEWARGALMLAGRTMAAVSILDSDAVVIDQAEMEKRDVKRAEKRGWPIADQVYIRPVRKGGERKPASGEEAHYSHRFWVRGHTKHFPIGTRMATGRPDLVKACTREGAASCGFCRRVWTPPFIKGPDDKPLVLKSLVKRS
jgi:hypothetical protein